MAVTITTFRERYLEFTETDDDLVTAKLAEAGLLNDESAYGSTELYEAAVYCHTAGLLLDSVFGSPMGSTESVNTRRNKYLDMYNEVYKVRIRRRMQISGGGLT